MSTPCITVITKMLPTDYPIRGATRAGSVGLGVCPSPTRIVFGTAQARPSPTMNPSIVAQARPKLCILNSGCPNCPNCPSPETYSYAKEYAVNIINAVMNVYIKTMTEDHGNEVVAQACTVLHPPQDRTTRSCSAYGCSNCRKYIDVSGDSALMYASKQYSGGSAFVADMVKENQIRYDDLALDSNRTQELAGIGSLAKGFRQYLIWDRRRTFKRVN
ncbi:hypothetical protein TEA_010226 [Camellia sinensis var. sinensis]|uniref:Uncharacterized protein n=1 Tax=Camellia sinensis var. sinensis TaxID=542762 RepID=A0A4S4EIV2_CAMSN|nr:hypothetical protein TEA_010226 [Camellia sinensis var. sinensis]